ncbi:MAG: hypothetical protein RIF33_16540 [Cyclobacteriaceae bacterium]
MKKLTISVSEEVYSGLYDRIGSGKISKFLDNLARPHVVDEDIINGYKAMAEDHQRDAEAEIWTENLSSEIKNETW